MSRDFDAGRQALVRDVQATLRGLHSAVDSLSQAIADRLDVNRTDLRCIQALGQFGPHTAGQLAERSGLSTGALTSAIDRLEKAGFVRRVRDVVDRRRVYVELTPAASQLMDGIYRDLLINSSAMMAGYSDEALMLVRDFVRQGCDVVQVHTERVHAMPLRLDTGIETD